MKLKLQVFLDYLNGPINKVHKGVNYSANYYGYSNVAVKGSNEIYTKLQCTITNIFSSESVKPIFSLLRFTPFSLFSLSIFLILFRIYKPSGKNFSYFSIEHKVTVYQPVW